MTEWLKRSGLAVAATALMAGTMALPAAAADYTIKAVFLANTDDEDYDGLLVFKDYVEAQSNGAIEVEIYPGGQLCGNPRECLEALQGGIVEVFLTTFGGFGNILPEAQVMDLPYIFGSDRIAECALANDTDFFQKLREAPLDKTVAWPEVYTSLATGVIEGTKNGITDIVGMKFHEHLKFITLDGHAYMGAMWMMNNDIYQSMPDDLKQIVNDGFDALRWTTIVFPKRRQIEAYETFKEAGGEIYVPSAEEKAQFVDAAQPVWGWYTDNFGDEWLTSLQGAIATCEEEIAAQQG
jgi:TRAP-type C4-dicarboxylate transport system substrate-binding protein